MDDSLRNVNEVLAELEGIAIKTSQGQFIKLEDARRLLERREAARAIEAKEAPRPKTVEQARSLAKKYLADAGLPKGPPRLGQSVPASDPHPSSRT